MKDKKKLKVSSESIKLSKVYSSSVANEIKLKNYIEKNVKDR